MTVEDIKERLCECGLEETIVLENPSYSEAIMGLSDDNRVVYSVDKIVTLLKKDGMSEVEAAEFFDYNILPISNQGEFGPIFVYEHFFD